MRALPWLPLVLAACSAPPGAGPVDRVVRPRSVTTSASPVQAYSLPWAWSSLRVAEPLMAAERGLFELSAEGIVESRSSETVAGLLALDDGAVLVVKGADLFEWRDDQLRPSLLQDTMPRVDALLGRRGDELWLGRGAELLRFDGAALEATAMPAAISQVQLAAQSDRVTLVDAAGAHALFAPAMTGAELQPLDDELPGITALAPFGAHDVLAIAEDGKLWRRLAVEGGVAWRRVALTVAADDPGAAGLTFLLADPETGAVTAGSETTLYRLQDDSVIDQPLEFPLRHAQLGRNGVVWGLTAEGLRRVGSPEPVRFSESIAPLAEVHCVRCHAPDRQGGFSLITADDWRSRIDLILSATAPGPSGRARMPADTLTSLTDDDRAVLRHWKEDGLQ